MSELKPLPDPFDYCYEWDSPFGTVRKFSQAPHNGQGPDRSVTLFTADQMHAYALENRRAQPAAPAILMSAVFVKEGADDFAPQRLLPCGSAVYLAPPDAAPSVAPEPVAWEGGEGWESLAWELCADENGEDACNELIWEGGPIPEPWGDRWMKYEGEAKRLIALVHKHAAHPPRAPLTEEIESADKLLRHLGLDPERCRTEGGSLNVSRIKTLLADAAPTARESAMEELLRSAAAIAQRHGAGTAWDRFGASIKALGIGAITARTYRLLPSDTERQQQPTTDPSRLADDLSNIGTMSPRIRKLYDDAAAFIRSTQAPLTPWQSMKTAPKDGTAVLVLLDASDIPHAARWLRGPDDARATEETTGAGWHLTWDGSPIAEHDGPRYWMHCPDDPDESDIEAAHGIGEKP